MRATARWKQGHSAAGERCVTAAQRSFITDERAVAAVGALGGALREDPDAS
jgi:hypothetical protein